MTRPCATAFALFTSCLLAAAPADPPQTRPERTGYRETSHYDDVIAFLDAVATKDGPVVVTTIGESTRGKKIPLAIVSRPRVSTPEEARKAGKVVVYIQANIHGGEVEGKEASLMLLRELAAKPGHPWLYKLVLLVAPIYNIDGNDAFGDAAKLRDHQDGPDPIGRRENGQGLDLNRDGMKAETPEMRAALRHVYTAWDPAIALDLHTTNGTRHGYRLTYSPPLNPNTEAGVLTYARDKLLPAVRARLDRDENIKTFDYGNLENRGGKPGWYAFGDEGRYVTNYVGLRNRVGILSEATSFLPLKDRVESTLAFVSAILDEAARDAEKIRALTAAADARVIAWGDHPETAPPLGVRFEVAASPTKEQVPIEKLEPGAKVDHRKAPARFETHDLTVYDRFRATKTARLPAAYVMSPRLANVAELLRRHGIAVGRLTEPWRGAGDEFLIEGLTPTGRFQDRAMSRLEGRFTPNPEATAPAGSFVVSTAQPLGILAFLLLEPESLDGVAAWGFLEGSIGEKTVYPVVKAAAPVRSAMGPLP